MSILLLPCILALLGSPDDVPEALRKAREARGVARIPTAHVEWSERRLVDGKMLEMFFTSRCATEDLICVLRGGADGVVSRRVDNDGRREGITRPHSTLVKEQRSWSTDEGSVIARSKPGSDKPHDMTFDIRTVGLNPVLNTRTLEEHVASVPGLRLEYSSSTGADGLHMVTAQMYEHDVRGGRVVWWIDPSRDWSVVKTQIVHSAGGRTAREFDLQQVDGVWFPTRIRTSDAETGQLYGELVILSAEFNHPEHPSEFSPSDIGIEPGTLVTYQEDDGAYTSKYWDGREAVLPENWFARVARGEVKYGPNVARELWRAESRNELEAAGTIAPDAASTQPVRGRPTDPTLSAWEAYTRDFIRENRLSAEQSERAWQILRDCQDQANSFLKRHRQEIENLRWADAGNPESKPARLQELLAPIDDIFHSRLVPRLDSLLTREQRAAAKNDSPAVKSGPGSP